MALVQVTRINLSSIEDVSLTGLGGHHSPAKATVSYTGYQGCDLIGLESESVLTEACGVGLRTDQVCVLPRQVSQF